jgi:two-component system, OmpR family, sensor histidine kinase KdpD
MDGPRDSGLLRPTPPPPLAGVAVVVAGVALVTVALYPLGDVAPRVSLGVVYLVVVLVASTVWGLWLGIGAALLSAVAFNWFHIPPTGRLSVAQSENWVALATFLVVAVAVSAISEAARQRAAEADARRREADLTAELAGVLLGADRTADALGDAAHRVAAALGSPSAALVVGAEAGDERRVALPVGDAGTLLLPADLEPAALERARTRVVPALAPLLAAALHRDALRDEVVETAALRHSDVVKTAILRAVSHDLRSPLTAIVAAGDALGSPSLSDEDRRELSATVVAEGARLARLIDKLLDLSKLEGGSARPRPDWSSLDEVLRAAGEGQPGVSYAIDPELPLVRADGAQLERAFANIVENAVRHSGGQPVSVRARAVGPRLVVRVVDRGPGISAAEQERIFAPFHRAEGAAGGGAGLGLAIARGFVEANGGRLRVESLPGQGSTFVVELPLPGEEA